GSVDSGFTPGTGPDGVVHCIVVQPDGKLVIAGSFTTVNAQSRNHIARLNADGTLESATTFIPVDVGPGALDYVRSVAVQADGKLDAAFDPGGGTGGLASDANGVSLQADGKVLLVGQFSSYNGTTHNLIARLLNDTATQSLSLGNTQVQWQRGGAAPEVSQVT